MTDKGRTILQRLGLRRRISPPRVFPNAAVVRATRTPLGPWRLHLDDEGRDIVHEVFVDDVELWTIGGMGVPNPHRFDKMRVAATPTELFLFFGSEPWGGGAPDRFHVWRLRPLDSQNPEVFAARIGAHGAAVVPPPELLGSTGWIPA